jgi:uncharacterized protein (TIGR02145 family)
VYFKLNYSTMRKITLSIVLLFWGAIAFGQVRISSDNGDPHPSAGLDVSFENRGFLPPRLTTEQRDGIANPAEGLMIFNVTTKCIEFFAFNGWHAGNCAEQPVSPFVCGQSFIDERDGQVYTSVLIGSQCWMAENLNYSQSIGVEWCYDDDPANCEIFGKLYDWNAAMQGESTSGSEPSGVRGVCPSGWHLPSHHEWTTLERAVCTSPTCETDFPYDFTTGTGWDKRGTDEALRLKAQSSLWLTNNGNNTSGFTALPAGAEWIDFWDVGLATGWWSCTLHDEGRAWARIIQDDDWSGDTDGVWRGPDDLFYGYSVRCIKD